MIDFKVIFIIITITTEIIYVLVKEPEVLLVVHRFLNKETINQK